MDNIHDDKDYNRDYNHGPGSRVWMALTLMVVGAALLLQRMGVWMPDWLFNWPVLLIVIGIFMGFNHGFRGGAWAVLIIVGGFFLLDDLIPGASIHRFIWPFFIFAIGIMILIRPHRYDKRNKEWQQWRKDRHAARREWKEEWKNKWSGSIGSSPTGSSSSEDYIDATTVFGGVHKTIVSKDFKGGDITVFMGGAEINLSQADINGVAALDITQVMGGTKLIVPSHWEIRTQMTSVFGNIEDKREQNRVTNPDKVLVIDGTSVFGGIEIRNY